jgi:hypothetical protein
MTVPGGLPFGPNSSSLMVTVAALSPITVQRQDFACPVNQSVYL